jgi:hypothetical protein
VDPGRVQPRGSVTSGHPPCGASATRTRDGSPVSAARPLREPRRRYLRRGASSSCSPTSPESTGRRAGPPTSRSTHRSNSLRWPDCCNRSTWSRSVSPPGFPRRTCSRHSTRTVAERSIRSISRRVLAPAAGVAPPPGPYPTARIRGGRSRSDYGVGGISAWETRRTSSPYSRRNFRTWSWSSTMCRTTRPTSSGSSRALTGECTGGRSRSSTMDRRGGCAAPSLDGHADGRRGRFDATGSGSTGFGWGAPTRHDGRPRGRNRGIHSEGRPRGEQQGFRLFLRRSRPRPPPKTVPSVQRGDPSGPGPSGTAPLSLEKVERAGEEGPWQDQSAERGQRTRCTLSTVLPSGRAATERTRWPRSRASEGRSSLAEGSRATTSSTLPTGMALIS